MRDEDQSERRRYGVVLGEVLRILRERTGFSQTDLVRGTKVNVSQATISRFELGTSLPNLWELWCLAKALGVSHALVVQAVEIAFVAKAGDADAPERVARAGVTTAAFQALEQVGAWGVG